jgi:hypothetical protein
MNVLIAQRRYSHVKRSKWQKLPDRRATSLGKNIDMLFRFAIGWAVGRAIP